MKKVNRCFKSKIPSKYEMSTGRLTETMSATDPFTNLFKCRQRATFGLILYLLLLQSIPVRASMHFEKASAYRYQGPSVLGGSNPNAKPSNEINKETTEESLRMKDLPRFTAPILNSSTPVGRDAFLDCFVENAENFMIAWLRVDTQTILSMDDKIISRNHRLSVTPSTDRKHWRLTIREVKSTDKGWYMCQVSTDPMLSQMGLLEVTEPAYFIDNETSADVIAKEGQSVKLKCKAAGHPVPVIKWKREDKKQITNGKIVGTDLEFERISRTDFGAFLCIASNGVPPVSSRRISISVLYPPTIHLHIQVAKAPIGERIHLNCTARGNPAPNVTWYRGNQRVVSDGHKYDLTHDLREKSVFSSLEILFVDRTDDLTTYTCEGNNSEGSTRDTIKIQVLEKISYDLPAQTFPENSQNIKNDEDEFRPTVQHRDSLDQQRLQQQQKETKIQGQRQNGFEYSSSNGGGLMRNQTEIYKSKWETNIAYNTGPSSSSSSSTLRFLMVALPLQISLRFHHN